MKLNVVIMPPLKAILAVNLVQDLHSNLALLIHHYFILWILELDQIDELILRLTFDTPHLSEAGERLECARDEVALKLFVTFFHRAHLGDVFSLDFFAPLTSASR